MASWNSNNYDGRYMNLSISESVDAINNRSTLTWTLSSIGGSANYYTIGETTIVINGTQVYHKAQTAWSSYAFPAAKGSVSGTITVNHNSNGSKSINVSFKTRVYIYEPLEYGGSMPLSNIDRNAPTVACSTSGLGTSGFTVNASASAGCNLWWYSLDGGSWTEFCWSNVTSASKTFTGLSSANHTVNIAARRTYNYVNGYSSAASADCVAPTILISTSGLTSSSVTVTATANVTCNLWQYSTNGGTSWTQFSTTETTSASKTITGLTPNGTYSIKVRARKKSNSLYGTSAARSVTTLGGSLLNSVTAFAADVASPAIVFNWTIYAATFYHKLAVKVGNTTVFTISGLTGSVGTSNKSITLTATQRTALLTAMSTVKSVTATFQLTTYSSNTYGTVIGTTSSATAVISTSAALSAPAFSNSAGFTYYDANSTAYGVTGDNQILIKGYSQLVLSIYSAVAKNNASIAKYSVTLGSKSLDSVTPDPFVFGTTASYGNLSLIVTATDSRGYTVAKTKTVTVINYTDITIDNWHIRRVNEVESTVQLAYSGTVSPVYINSVAKNTVQSSAYRVKLSTASSYGGWIALSPVVSASQFSFTTEGLIGSGSSPYNFNANSIYDIQVRVVDKLHTDTIQLKLLKGTPLVALRSQKVGINNPDPQGALDVIGNSIFTGNVTMNGYGVQGFVRDVSGEDFNTITASGVYFYASGGSNKPTAAVGILEVFNYGTYVMQRFTGFTLGNPLYVRSYPYDGGWQAWTQK